MAWNGTTSHGMTSHVHLANDAHTLSFHGNLVLGGTNRKQMPLRFSFPLPPFYFHSPLPIS